MKNKYMTVDEAKEKLPLIIDKVRYLILFIKI